MLFAYGPVRRSFCFSGYFLPDLSAAQPFRGWRESSPLAPGQHCLAAVQPLSQLLSMPLCCQHPYRCKMLSQTVPHYSCGHRREYIKKIYSDGELTEEATIRKFRIVQTERTRQVSRSQNHYNLQMIIAVGFKVNSQRVVQFQMGRANRQRP